MGSKTQDVTIIQKMVNCQACGQAFYFNHYLTGTLSSEEILGQQVHYHGENEPMTVIQLMGVLSVVQVRSA